MCGIVGAIAERDVVPILIEGLKRLEYRGYDSAGVAILDKNGCLARERRQGKVAGLEQCIKNGFAGHLGIAHTRWATHGEPSEANAHPHICRKTVAVVHNGIIENYDELRKKQQESDYAFTSETDTEVIVHQVHDYHVEKNKDLLSAVKAAVKDLKGAYALGVVSNKEPGRLVAARLGSPLVVGIGIGEYFIASDVAALLPVTQRFIFLEDGDIADISRDGVKIYDAKGKAVEREIRESALTADAVERGPYRHYMLKEIFEQPRAIGDTLEGRIVGGKIFEQAFGASAAEVFDKVQGVHIIACGTSYHAGLIARYWFESIAGIPCSVEVASEFRYRKPVVRNNSLIVTISQSGETADTLAGLKEAKRLGFGHSLAICNVPESSLVRESDLVFMTRAGPEIGVASTKAFTTQLVALLMLVIVLGRRFGISEKVEKDIVNQMTSLPGAIEQVLKLDDDIKNLSEQFGHRTHALFLGRGTMYPVAMEGALKLKEISYIHAEAYPAGELKHGPLALVDAEMPIIAVAPNNELLEKLKSNLQEVRARGGELIVFADPRARVKAEDGTQVMLVTGIIDDIIAPIVYTVPLQLLSYHVAVLKGTDVDKPRNLAKSVTVE
ncbi:MAG: glutamine--fructose-6-phosphate transaminase (isomerizing) [Gammaproteobacteria bacterium]|nr:MAG: glutamine--fructose-6-phosphate transaminase (isomerizing) [Gammaproteobacteria bacterium]